MCIFIYIYIRRHKEGADEMKVDPDVKVALLGSVLIEVQIILHVHELAGTIAD